jgi:hypothetical protein
LCAERRLNKVNFKKEFFRVDIAELEGLVRAHHGEFHLTPVSTERRRRIELGEQRHGQVGMGDENNFVAQPTLVGTDEDWTASALEANTPAAYAVVTRTAGV